MSDWQVIKDGNWENIEKGASEFRKKKIKEMLEKEKLDRTDISFLLTFAERYNYEKLKKFCELKEKQLNLNIQEEIGIIDEKLKENLNKIEEQIDEEKLKKEVIDEIELKEGGLEVVNDRIVKILKKYVDLREEYYQIISHWIIGTYIHKYFLTYPYLYFNAVKGSGKTRLLKLIAELSKNGKLLVHISEAVLFRTAKERTLCIDELEHIMGKDKVILRELLNAGYKQGLSVERAVRLKVGNKEKWVIESFDVYCPICIANIFGLDDVLEDRCITLILEKSNRKEITKLMENFKFDEEISQIKEKLIKMFSVDSANSEISEDKGNIIRNIYKLYNNIISNYTTTLNTLTTLSTQTTLTTLFSLTTQDTISIEEISKFINKLKESSLSGRDIELFFPLLFISLFTGRFNELLAIAEKLTQEKKKEEIAENRDIMLLKFIVEELEETNDFISIKRIAQEFKEKNEDEEWINSRWISRSLKRLGIIIEKRRISHGVEVRINFAKAREKLRFFESESQSSEEKEEKKEIDININIQQNFQQNINFEYYPYYEVVKPINITITYDGQDKPFKAEPNQIFMFSELGDNCFEIIKILQEEGYITPVIEEENE